MSPTVKFAIKLGLVTALAFLGALQIAVPDGIDAQEWITVATATLTVPAGYFTVGYLTPLEAVGRNADGADGPPA